jgi:RNA polymerase sigma-70 factor, ECF subfamily
VKLIKARVLHVRDIPHDHEGECSLRMAMRAQRGDQQASEWLYHRFQPRVFSLMRRIVGQQDAEDMTQQCFLTMLRRIRHFAGRSGFWTWFYRLSVNEALQHLRKRSKHALRTESHQAAVEDICVPRCETVEQRDAVEHALRRLTDIQRLTLKLHFQEGLSYKDIADKLSIPMGTVGSRINQAKSYAAQSLSMDHQRTRRTQSIRNAA